MEFIQKYLVEFIAVTTSLLYTFLAGKNKTWCWIFAIISSGIYTITNYQVKLYFFSGLHLFYVIIAIYGWFSWTKTESTASFRYIGIKNLNYLTLGIGGSFILAFLASKFTDQQLPYLDALNFTFGIVASWMISKRIIESWLYLIAINLISITLYLQVGWFLSAILYLFLSLLAILAFRDWNRLIANSKKAKHDNF